MVTEYSKVIVLKSLDFVIFTSLILLKVQNTV